MLTDVSLHFLQSESEHPGKGNPSVCNDGFPLLAANVAMNIHVGHLFYIYTFYECFMKVFNGNGKY